MSKDKVCRTVRQYSREPIAAEAMDKLVEICEDYRTVKNYVYRRFGGIHSLEKLFPGYTAVSYTHLDVYKRQHYHIHKIHAHCKPHIAFLPDQNLISFPSLADL